jgi:hypothetical protein
MSKRSHVLALGRFGCRFIGCTLEVRAPASSSPCGRALYLSLRCHASVNAAGEPAGPEHDGNGHPPASAGNTEPRSRRQFGLWLDTFLPLAGCCAVDVAEAAGEETGIVEAPCLRH